MKRYLKLLFSVVFGAFFALNISAQCINFSSFGTGNFAGMWNNTVTATTCAFGGEYSTFNGVLTGNNYQFSATGGTGNYLTLTDLSDNVLVHGNSPINWTSTFSGSVKLHVNTDANCGTDFSCHTLMGVCLTCLPPPPAPGQACAVAIPITGITITNTTASVAGTTVGSFISTPPFCGTTFGTAPGMWYSFVAPCEGMMNVNTCPPGTAFDSKLGIFTGTCTSLICVAGNDDGCGLQSSVNFPVVGGTTYYIYVTGFGSATGAFTLNLAYTPDVCCVQIPLTAQFVPPTITVCPWEPFSGSLVITGGVPGPASGLAMGNVGSAGFPGAVGGAVGTFSGTSGDYVSTLGNTPTSPFRGGGTVLRNELSTAAPDFTKPYFYLGQEAPFNLYRFVGGTETLVSSGLPANITGNVWDRTNSTMYLTTTTALYTVNPNTGATTLVGNYHAGAFMIWIVVDEITGQMYGLEIGTSILYKINKATGATTVVGNVGISTNFGQDAWWWDGKIHSLAFNSGTFSTQYGTFNTTTGAFTMIKDHGFAQVGAQAWAGQTFPGGYDIVWNMTTGLTQTGDNWSSFDGVIGVPGVYNYNVTVTDACGASTTAQFVVNVINAPDAFACNDHVNISVQQDCAIDFRADMFNEGPYGGCYDHFELYIYPLGNANHPQALINVNNKKVTFPTAWINKTHTFVVKNPFTGNQCWGTFTAEDKIGPVITCAQNLIIECYDPIPYVAPTVSDNCSNWVVTFTDQIVNNYCAEFSRIVYRTWTVTDNNNGMTASCIQTISMRRATLANLGVPPNWDGVQNDMIECSTAYPVNQWGNPHPSYTGGPTGIGWTPNSSTGACGTIEVFYNDRVFTSDCGPKILRDWTIIDDCTGTIVNHTQIIRVTDSTPPTVCGPEEVLYEQGLITISTNAWSCTADYVVPKPLLCDNCDPNPTYTVVASAGTVVYVPASKTWYVFGLPIGIHGITYIAVDWCGNTSEHTFYVEVLDLIPPMAACEQYKQVSLTFDGTHSVAKVWAQSFDSGSHDHGCGPVWFKVWRADGKCMPYNCDNSACTQQWFDDYVIYCCEDVDQEVMTTLRVFDKNPGAGPINPSRMAIGGDLFGHYNDCWTIVKIEEKVPPFLACENIVIDCEDNIHPDHTGYPVLLNTCGDHELKWTDNLTNLNTCNIGYIIRTWEVLKRDGSSYSPRITCNQRIDVIETLPFDPLTIVFPYISQEHCLKNEPLGDKPTWEINPCNIVDASIIKVDTFRFVDGACYKILREWAVVDWCVYKPNTGAEWNLDEFRYISNNRRAILDPAKFSAADRDGYYRFTEVIMVYDNTAAIIEVEDACIGIATCVTAPEAHKFTAGSRELDTDCGGEYEWTYVIHDVCCGAVIQFSSNNNAYKGANYQGGVSGRSSADKLKGASAEFLLLPSLAVGEYRITWTLRDGCANVTTEYSYITVADKKAPTPFLVDISTATMTNCMVEISARFFDKGACNDQCLASYDNCADVLYFTFTPVLPKLDPSWTLDAHGLYYFNATTGAKSNRAAYMLGNAHSWNPVKHTAGRVFTGPTRQVNVDVYVWDKFALNEACDDGNFDYATVLLTLNSFDDNCPDTPFPLVGNITRAFDGAGINKVEVVAAKDNEARYTNTENGAYSMNLPEGVNVITPGKRDDYTNGVSTLDLIMIQQYLLGLNTLNANQLIAADANANGTVTGADIKQIRDLILGVTTSLPSNDSWVFSPRSESVNMTQASTLNFTGTKVGDVNYSANPMTDGTTVAPRHANVINLVVNEVAVEAGEIEVEFTAENFNNVRGTQMTLNLNGMNFAGVTAGAMDVTAENFGLIRDGIVTVSWNNANGVSVADGAVLFTLKLNANVNGNLSEMISAGSQITAAEAYTTDALNVNGLNVTFRGAEEVVFELYQNEPNPFAERTVIGFNLPEAGDYTLTVFDVTGKVVSTVKGQGQKGYNREVLNSTDMSAGVMYYQLDSNNFTATKKMIIIK